MENDDKAKADHFWNERENQERSRLVDDGKLMGEDWHIFIDGEWKRVSELDLERHGLWFKETYAPILVKPKNPVRIIPVKDPHGYISGFITFGKIIAWTMIIAGLIMIGIAVSIIITEGIN